MCRSKTTIPHDDSPASFAEHQWAEVGSTRPRQLPKGAGRVVTEMGAVFHDGGHMIVILIGLVVAGVLWLIAKLRN
jgi:hypothetical protein